MPDWLLPTVLFLAGLLLGAQINWGIYSLAWHPRTISPWSPPPPDVPPRVWADRIPVLGWLRLRRESAVHGSGFWIRPLLIELTAGIGGVALYCWTVQQAALVPEKVVAGAADSWMLPGQFLIQVILFSLLAVATFIDFDEQTIPDAITVPGTLVLLVFMALWPSAGLPVAEFAGPGPRALGHLRLTTPSEWPAWLDGLRGLGVGLACFAGWCLAIWPRTVTWRRGWWKALQYATVSMFRYPLWWALVLMLAVGGGGIVATWAVGGNHWHSLLTALVGMAFGGGLIWAVRIVGGSALGKEAMGFGDVTLMAMIGAYVGWQSSLIVFFLAPFAAVVISVARWLLTGRRDIAFGPYLCAGAVVLIVWWAPAWEPRVRSVFSLGWMIPLLLFFCLLLLGGMLSLWRLLERGLRRPEKQESQGPEP